VEDITWLTERQAHNAIEALKAIRKRGKDKGEGLRIKD